MNSELEKAAEKEARLVNDFMDEFCDADFDSRPALATGKYDRDELIEGLAHHIMFLNSELDPGEDWEHLGYATVDSAHLLIADPEYNVNFDAENRAYAREHVGFIRPMRDGRALSAEEVHELTEQLNRGEIKGPLWQWEKCEENAEGFVIPHYSHERFQHTREISLENGTSAVLVETGYGDRTYSVEGKYTDMWMGRKLAEVRIRFIDEEDDE